MGIISKIFGSYSERQVKKIEPIFKEVEALSEKYAAMSENELQNITPIFKERLANGETLDDILPDAFAAVREASYRVLNKKHYKVQVIGGIALHQGRIIEMKTGEGKTQTAALPTYLNALAGKGVHIVTVNDYLARYGSEHMGKVYGYLGLSTGLNIHGINKKEKQAAYNADITYGTQSEFGFDYLRDNMVTYKEDMVQRGHVFAIVDEVDSILIDEAKTPLIISGPGEKSTDLYEKADKLVKRLKIFKIKELDAKESHDDIMADYIVDEKARTAVLTQFGIKKAEEYFNIENLSDYENTAIHHHINQSIRAIGVMQNDVDYVVKDNEVIIVDAFTGRLMPGRRYSDGLHQAIEAKEGVKIERENKTHATITFQNYFRLYQKLSGMTGTALTEENEFREIYNLDVVEVPTNKPMIRDDRNDIVYVTVNAKYKAIIAQIKECNEKGQPVLVGTVSVDKSEFLSKLLTKEGVKHNVLNAKHNDKEAEIVAQAGRFGAVTISTNMAGRGTDIMLGGNAEFMAQTEMRKQGYEEEAITNAFSFFQTSDEEILKAREHAKELIGQYEKIIAPENSKVRKAGGLFVLGTERHESRRIDNQLRGRSGRQGDPGESRFFLSLEDDLLRLFGSDRIMTVASRWGEDQPIDAKILSNTIENAQKRLEGTNFERRKNLLRYDDVMNQQRKIIYAQRKDVLDGGSLKEKIYGMINETIDATAETYCSGETPLDWNFESLKLHFADYLLTNENDFIYESDEQKGKETVENIKELLVERADKIYQSREAVLGEENMREFERLILLRTVDSNWIEHIDAMSDLMDSIGLHAYAQRDPIVEYRMQGADMFDEIIANIKETTVKRILTTIIKKEQPIRREQVVRPNFESVGGSAPVKRTPIVKKLKVGRNDPCPCGSGLKYKKCCGVNSDGE